MVRAEPYHREDLRGEMLAAGRAHVEAHGHADLSIRALALGVGVSPGAPYHHFPNRRSLLLALALDGYDRLNAAGVAVQRKDGTAAENLAALGASFLRFCADNPRLFELMYESELTRPILDPRIAAAQDAGFDLVQEAVARMRPQGDASRRRHDIIAFWSTLYGYASLTGKNMLDRYAVDSAEAAAATLVSRIVAALGSPDA